MMSEASGQKVEAREIHFDDWANSHGIREGFFRQGLRRMYEDYNEHGLPGGNALALKCILGREPRTLAQYFQELATREKRAA